MTQMDRPDVRVLFWFDVEDCMVPQSDDAAKRLAWILERHGARGTMKLVGQKARVLEQRIRYDVIDALKRHDVGFHSNWHGLRPQIAEYLAPLDWDAGVAEFERREGPGLDDVQRVFGSDPVTYGQPGPNWAPQVFPVLRRWGIRTYVSGFGYVGIDCQPFWYGGVLCTSHMYGSRLDGSTQEHLMGMNFELGRAGELEKHQAAFSRSLEQLAPGGGLISILNHPCTLVLEEWFSTYLKPRHLTEAGYQHFEQFVAWALSLPNVRPTCAGELPDLYPDRALGRVFTPGELLTLADALSEEVNYCLTRDHLGVPAAVSAAEALGMLAHSLAESLSSGTTPAGALCRPVYNPHHLPQHVAGDVSVPWEAFSGATAALDAYIDEHGELPDSVPVSGIEVGPADFLGALARVLARLYRGEAAPAAVEIRPMPRPFETYVDEEAARSGWRSVMMPPGFSAPNLVALAKLEAWTLKPAIMRA
ncbi:MAG: hypothetical protein ACYC5O_20390 [Anaerolineae bacterium]